MKRKIEPSLVAGVFSKLLLESQKLVGTHLDTREFILKVIEDERLTVAQIARILGNSRQSVQKMADKLVGEGLCGYSENYFHRRAKILVLTSQGTKALSRIKKEFEIKVNKLTSRVSAEKIRDAVFTLELLNW